MKVATYNVNGINGRLPKLLEWLEEARPDVVCLQELKSPQAKFPAAAIERAGYGSIWQGEKSWNGVAILARGGEPVEIRRGLPGDKKDTQSRYLEAAVEGFVIACLHLPNDNPAPGPKFDYKLRWFERLARQAADLLAENVPVVLAGDFNVMPKELEVYNPKGWEDDALHLVPRSCPDLRKRSRTQFIVPAHCGSWVGEQSGEMWFAEFPRCR